MISSVLGRFGGLDLRFSALKLATDLTDTTDLCGFLPLELSILYIMTPFIRFSAGFNAQALSAAPFNLI
ncbi:hypothetical protein MCETHM1_00775 [Flavobacteriaceae bacterium]